MLSTSIRPIAKNGFFRPLTYQHGEALRNGSRPRGRGPRGPRGSSPSTVGRVDVNPLEHGLSSRASLRFSGDRAPELQREPWPPAPASEPFNNVAPTFAPVTPPTPRRQEYLRHVQDSTSSSVLLSVPKRFLTAPLRRQSAGATAVLGGQEPSRRFDLGDRHLHSIASQSVRFLSRSRVCSVPNSAARRWTGKFSDAKPHCRAERAP